MVGGVVLVLLFLFLELDLIVFQILLLFI